MFPDVRSDEVRLKQVLLNILGNAVKFTERGSIKISILQTKHAGTPSISYGFQVTDSGIGISKEAKNNLFLPFSQADASMTRRFGGTGLGLVLSRKIAQALGGDLVLVDSQLGQGSTFLATFAVDLAEPRDDAATNVVNPAGASSIVKSSDLSLSNKRILVVEDSSDNRALLRLYLKPERASVSFVENGLDAVEIITTGAI